MEIFFTSFAFRLPNNPYLPYPQCVRNPKGKNMANNVAINPAINPVGEWENEITEGELVSEASKGRFYSYEKHSWQTIGCLEWLIRMLFACCMDSVQTTCLRRSWNSIEKMPDPPLDIKGRIQNLFFDSLYDTNPLSSYSGAISRIFCKEFCKGMVEGGYVTDQIDIQQHRKDRSFGIFHDRQLVYSVANSEYGQLDFYDHQDVKVAVNKYDTLWEGENGRRLGAVRLAVDYPRLDACMEVYGGNDLPLMRVVENKEKVTLIFRDTITNQLLAVGNLLKFGRLINWTVTITDQVALDEKQIPDILLGWAILKYSQHYHFPNPDDLDYLSTPPKVQRYSAKKSLISVTPRR